MVRNKNEGRRVEYGHLPPGILRNPVVHIRFLTVGFTFVKTKNFLEGCGFPLKPQEPA
jgi:hypothetical protein